MKNILIKIGFCLIIFYLIIAISKDLRKSIFLSNQNRINLVVFKKSPVFISCDLKNKTSYYFDLYPDIKIQVPGGYGEYRLGALLKLAELEKRPEIIQRTFSLLTNTFIDYYFYPNKTEIYFGKEEGKDTISSISLLDVLKSKSNANFFDRIFIYFTLLNQNKRQKLNYQPLSFAFDYQGYFYKESLRAEKANLQILYTSSYKTALNLSKIFEGEGIRVADISETKKNTEDNSNRCLILQSKKTSFTASYLARYFNCDVKYNEQTGVYDLVFYLNSLEKLWETN